MKAGENLMKLRIFDYLVAYLMIFIILLCGSLGPLTLGSLMAMAVFPLVPALVIGTLTNIIINPKKTLN